MTRLQFLGATSTVTGSKYLVGAARASILVDCGLFQGFKQLRLRNWAPLPVDPRRLAAVVLTHAHVDHSGYLPLLVRNGFRGPVYCTEATRDLCGVLLPDSAYLQEEQAEHANRHGYSKHSPALPLYTRDDARRALERLVPMPFDHDFPAGAGIAARFTPAGHILGAACVSLRIAGRTLVFSGDLGRAHDMVMRPPERIEHADALVLESTYGNRLHGKEDAMDELARIVSETAARGGSVIVPSFAVGRAQALLLALHRLKQAGRIPRAVNVYLDSPMASNVTAIYRRHPELHRLTPAECDALAQAATHVQTPEQSRALDESQWPKVIVAGSGMASGGRVLHHIARYGPDPRSAILFTGFQAGGTRGEAMVNGAAEVKIHGAYVPIRAAVHNLDNLSAHADWSETLEWLRGFREPPARVFLTHGEPAAADALRKHVAEALGWACEVPGYLETATLPGKGARRGASNLGLAPGA